MAIAWNDGEGQVSLDHPLLLSPDHEESVAAGLLNADTDRIPDLVIASGSAVFLARPMAGSKRSLSLTRIATVSGARSLAGGDITGDGVDDLVLAVEGGIRVLRGEAVQP